MKEPSPGNAGRRPKILVIRLRSIGDMLLSTPALTMLREALPEAEISVVSETLSERMVRLHPAVDSVIILDRRAMKAAGTLESLFVDTAFLAWMRKRDFDMAVDFYGGPRSAFMAYASGAPVRVGFDKPNRRVFYTHAFPEAVGGHTVEVNLALVSDMASTGLIPRISGEGKLHSRGRNAGNDYRTGPAGFPRSLEERYPLVLPVTKAEKAAAGWLLSGVSRPYAAVHPGARFPTKSWPADWFASILAWLFREYGIHPVMVGGPEDVGESKRMVSLLAAEGVSAISVAGKAGLGELAAIFTGAVFFLGNDSGPMHIASSQGCPVVVLFGPSDPVRWRPWGTLHEVVAAGLDCSPCPQISCATGRGCMGTIGEERVRGAIERVLESVCGYTTGDRS